MNNLEPSVEFKINMIKFTACCCQLRTLLLLLLPA